MAEWQPIDTAPKEIVRRWDDGNEFGQVILVWPYHGSVVIARWWQSRGKDGGIINSNFIIAADNYDACHPTHWMPLPDAPESESL